MNEAFTSIIDYLREYPCLLLSFLSFLFCNFSLIFIRRKFGYAGLCCYMSLCSVVANIQILYVVSYEMISTPVFLGAIIFCSSFLACDMVNEYYGEKKAKNAVYLSFLIQLFFIMNMLLTLGHVPLNKIQYYDFSVSQLTIDQNIKAIQLVFLSIPKLFLASCFSYLFSQLIGIFMFKIMKRTCGNGLNCIKQNISLFISSVITDTVVFAVVGLVIFADEPLSFHDLWCTCAITIAVRATCNLGNTVFMKFDMKNIKSVVDR